ncbi:urease subunit alpha [Candidatus Shikimatogenerans silvanidophilus]|uniref:urease subunit alpha n=1 Tax=Candidatus Shikimatogenerans silvanidophilus TaxID=2782547 RepID=UPI001BA672D6|nr:urease subunit alpha [Candidatus Shikimatogenerans silvanidophilus]
MEKKQYVKLYGPTVGDKIRLGDTSLFIEIEKDYINYGDECMFGAGKTIRDGMGQNSTYKNNKNILDLVITNAIIIDTWGIIKADIGIKNGKIVGIGKSGNPHTMDNINKNMIIGTETEIISAENKIVTAGCIDSHVHYICPQLLYLALQSGTTTVIGGGYGPTTSTLATNCTSGNIKNMILSTDKFPINIMFLGCGNSSYKEILINQLNEGCGGLKIHEDFGVTKSVINTSLEVSELFDIPVNIHTDTLNESGYVEDTISIFKNRTIHSYHTEGAGGGHTPDLLKFCSFNNILPSSTTPTIPYSINTYDEHIDMIMSCHHLNYDLKEDIEFAKSRIRKNTISAEGILHDMGAISMINSDSQAMGRIGEIIIKTWQLADKMKKEIGKIYDNENNNNEKEDNFRVKRYIAKYTINPAIVHGISKYVGSIEIGKIADIVIWNPKFFGVKPEMVIKKGCIIICNIGDPSSSISSSQPNTYKNMFNNYKISYLFTNKYSFENKKLNYLKLKKNIKPVKNCIKIKKHNLILNNNTPNIEIDKKTYDVYINGVKSYYKPSKSLPLSQKYFLF